MNTATDFNQSLPPRKKSYAFFVVVVITLLLPLLGPGGILTAGILGLALLGAPLFVVITAATVMCFALWAGFSELNQFGVLIERIRTLSDNALLLAIPLFMMSGAIMSRGKIAQRLVDFAHALVGWLPGGLAIASVVACMLFAAISGSSPATVIAIGTMVGPTLVAEGYARKFSHGLLTASGSLGILIPPSIPMIVYPIVNQKANIEVERLFAAGIGPGLLIGSVLGGYSIYRGIVDKVPRDKMDLGKLKASAQEGGWALAFPLVILGGIYGGIYSAVEAAGVSVVYAVAVEVFVHRAIKLGEIPGVLRETATFLGSLLVIMVAALSLSEFLEAERIPHVAVEVIQDLDLEPWQFLIALNLMLLVVGTMMDILSAMFIFVPLLAPIASAMGVDPIHFGIIFIVNLEIGYLTPPVGLNLFVSSALFNEPVEAIIKSVLPFIALMFGALMLITYVPAISIGLLGDDPKAAAAPEESATVAAEMDDDDTTTVTTEVDKDAPAEVRFRATLEGINKELEKLRASGAMNMDAMQMEADLMSQRDETVAKVRAEIEKLQSGGGLNMDEMQKEADLKALLDEFSQAPAEGAAP